MNTSNWVARNAVNNYVHWFSYSYSKYGKVKKSFRGVKTERATWLWITEVNLHLFGLFFCPILISHPRSSFSLNSLVLRKQSQSLQRLHLRLSSGQLRHCCYRTPGSEGANWGYYDLACHCSFPCLGNQSLCLAQRRWIRPPHRLLLLAPNLWNWSKVVGSLRRTAPWSSVRFPFGKGFHSYRNGTGNSHMSSAKHNKRIRAAVIADWKLRNPVHCLLKAKRILPGWCRLGRSGRH